MPQVQIYEEFFTRLYFFIHHVLCNIRVISATKHYRPNQPISTDGIYKVEDLDRLFL